MTYEDYLKTQAKADEEEFIKADGTVNYSMLTDFAQNDRVFLLRTLLNRKQRQAELFRFCLVAVLAKQHYSLIVRSFSKFWGVSRTTVKRTLAKIHKTMGLKSSQD